MRHPVGSRTTEMPRTGRCLSVTAVHWSTLRSAHHALVRVWMGPANLPPSLKLERRLVAGRWLGITLFALALALRPLDPRTMIAAYAVLGVAFAFSLTLARLIKQRRTGLLVGFVPTLVDGLLCAAMLPLVGGFDSPFYAVLYAVVVSAGMRLGFARGLLLAAAIAAVDLLWRIGGGSGADAAFTVRSGVLFMTVLLTSYF